MIDVLYTQFKEQLSEIRSDLIYKVIGPQEENKHRTYRRWQDKQAHLLGKLLTALLLKKYGYSHHLLKKVAYTKHLRPYIPAETFDFNISHSGEFVVCAFSAKQRVGIDIEQIQPVELQDFNSMLNNSDKEIIRSSKEPLVPFFKIWSAKEAILKAHGSGLVDDLYNVDINGDTAIFNRKRYFLKDVSIHPFYSSCVASPQPIDLLHMEEISIENLF
jgi:4'-phosphopantetheinyl transferase